jgi:hypothetical protein
VQFALTSYLFLCRSQYFSQRHTLMFLALICTNIDRAQPSRVQLPRMLQSRLAASLDSTRLD